MAERTRNTWIVLLAATVAVMAGAAAALGVFARGDGTCMRVMSPRGEHFDMAVTGVYAWNAVRVVAEGIGWDVVTLFVAVPALLAALPFIAKDSLRAKLFALGIFGYMFYQYLMYAVTWAFGPLFLLFVAVYALSLTAMGLIVASIDIGTLPSMFTDRFPRRGMAVLALMMAVLLTAMWCARIAGAALNGVQGVLLGQNTLVVQALDLGLIVPLSVFTAVTAWRGRPVGYLLCSALAVKAFTMAGAICAMLLSAWSYEHVLELPPLVIFASAAGASLWLGIRMFRSFIPAHRTVSSRPSGRD